MYLNNIYIPTTQDYSGIIKTLDKHGVKYFTYMSYPIGGGNPCHTIRVGIYTIFFNNDDMIEGIADY